MKESKRNSRIRLLVKRLNRQRKKQATQIDLLCNDIIKAHGDFIGTVRMLSFAAEFYESLIGMGDLDNLFYTAACTIKKQIPDVNIAFFLTQPDNFQLYAFDSSTGQTDEQYRLEQHFSAQLVRSVAGANRPCDLNELLEMGLHASPPVLKNTSAITIPIAPNEPAAAFMLIYKSSPQTLNLRQVALVCTVTRGLARAIRACCAAERAASHQD